MSIDTAQTGRRDRSAEPVVEAIIEMPLSVSMAFEDATNADERTLLDEIRLAAVDGYRAAVDTLTRAAQHHVAAIARADRPHRRELGAITVHTSRHDYGRDAFPYLHAHLVLDPIPVTGLDDGDTVIGSALADTLPSAQVAAVRTTAEQLHQAGYAVTQLPRSSPHGWELSAYVDDAVQQCEGGRGFSCARVQRGTQQLYPVDFDDPASRADRAAGRI